MEKGGLFDSNVSITFRIDVSASCFEKKRWQNFVLISQRTKLLLSSNLFWYPVYFGFKTFDLSKKKLTSTSLWNEM